MANTVTKVIDCYATSGYAPAQKTTPAEEWLFVQLSGGTQEAVTCKSATAANIQTRLVREAVAAVVTPTNSTGGATNVACYVTISTTTYPNDTVTLTGVDGGEYYMHIVGRA